MSFVQILADYCSDEILTVLSLVRWALNLVCWAVPIILIVLLTIDVAKIVTAGNLDDKIKKEVGNKIVTRLIYAVVIFLIPIIINAVFGLLPQNVKSNTGLGNSSWYSCWRAAGE